MGRLPDFLIIGAAKSGTSFLHEMLLKHPGVAFKHRPNMPKSQGKEIHYYDSRAYQRHGLQWYKAHFPFGSGMVTGEATPLYIFDPRVPARVYADMPEVNASRS